MDGTVHFIYKDALELAWSRIHNDAIRLRLKVQKYTYERYTVQHQRSFKFKYQRRLKSSLKSYSRTLISMWRFYLRCPCFMKPSLIIPSMFYWTLSKAAACIIFTVQNPSISLALERHTRLCITIINKSRDVSCISAEPPTLPFELCGKW